MSQKNDFLINRSYLTEIDFDAAPSAGQQFKFKDYPNLRQGVKGQILVFTGVEVFYDSTLATSPNNITCITAANLATLTLTIAEGSDEKIDKTPATCLSTFLQGGVVRRINFMPVTLTNCYVTVMSAGIAASRSVCFNWYYTITTAEKLAAFKARQLADQKRKGK